MLIDYTSEINLYLMNTYLKKSPVRPEKAKEEMRKNTINMGSDHRRHRAKEGSDENDNKRTEGEEIKHQRI